MAALQATPATTFVSADRVLARAEADPRFLHAFGVRPFETLAEAGVDGAVFLRGLLGLSEATDRELVDVVRTRLGATARAQGCAIAVEGCAIAAEGCAIAVERSAIAAQGCAIAVEGCAIAK